MNVLFVTSFSGLYGANRSLLNMIDGLLLKGVSCSVIIQMKGVIEEELNNRNIRYILIPYYNEIGGGFFGFIKGLIKFALNLILLFKFKNKLKNINPDIIHSNSSVAFFGAYLSMILSKPHVWHVREFLWDDYRIKYSFGDLYFNLLLNKSSGVICISESIFKSRVKNNVTLPVCKVIYNGIFFDKDLIDINQIIDKLSKRKEKVFVIGIVGTIVEGKNQLEAIRALNYLLKFENNFKLIIVGEGDDNYISRLKSEIDAFGISDYVHFYGLVNDVISIYDEMDVLLMCSKSEGLGRVTIEGMARGVSVVGFDNAGTSEIISNNFNGLLYSKDYMELGDKVFSLYMDPDFRLRLIKNGVNTVRHNFLIENYSSEILKLYNLIVSNNTKN